jgi:hypothetical protein
MSFRRVPLLAVDALVALWVVAWIAIGLRVGDEVDGLRDLGVSVAQTGAAVERTGDALGGIDVPFVGDQLREVGEGVAETGRSTRRSAAQAQDSAGALSVLLGAAIAFIPASALLIPYVPLRIARVRERRALAALDRRHGDDPRLDRLLAERARTRMSYQDLHALDGPPWAALDDEEVRRLAQAERERFGLSGGAR